MSFSSVDLLEDYFLHNGDQQFAQGGHKQLVDPASETQSGNLLGIVCPSMNENFSSVLGFEHRPNSTPIYPYQ